VQEQGGKADSDGEADCGETTRIVTLDEGWLLHHISILVGVACSAHCEILFCSRQNCTHLSVRDEGVKLRRREAEGGEVGHDERS